MTINCRWRRVLVARQTGIRPTITVRAQGVPGLTLTPDHNLCAREKTRLRWPTVSGMPAPISQPIRVTSSRAVGSSPRSLPGFSSSERQQ